MTTRRATALLSLVAALAAPAAAHADGDPASDVLLFRDAYLPYFPAPSKPASQTLTRLLREVRRAGYPMKLVLIQGTGDLGAYPDLLGRPDDYAKLLLREIAFRVKRPHLLIVMPSGLAGRNLGPEGERIIAGIEVDRSAKSDGLVRAALEAVAKVASANGHETAVPQAEPAERAGSRSSHTLLYVLSGVIVALGLAAIATAVVSRRGRRSRG